MPLVLFLSAFVLVVTWDRCTSDLFILIYLLRHHIALYTICTFFFLQCMLDQESPHYIPEFTCLLLSPADLTFHL